MPGGRLDRFRQDPNQIRRPADFAFRIVAPGDRQFFDAVTQMARHGQNLHIEAPPVQSEPGENAGHRARGEELETGLRITDTGHGHRANEKVSRIARDDFVPWLAHRYYGSLHVARPDHNVVALFEMRQKCGDVIAGGGVVRIHEKPAAAASLQHA